MKKPLFILMAAGLIMHPFAALSEDYGSPTSQPQQQAPPVAQTLVREGDFAIRLAPELALGNPVDEASAEDILTVAGVVPDNGWISDYPVTPQVMGQLQAAIVRSAAEERIPLSAEEATRGLYRLAVQMNLPVPASAVSPPQDRGSAAVPPPVQPDPAAVNNYYYDQGPPIVTYYPPPSDYLYLYDWVPYPAWWAGFWFPGFYICHNFTTTIVVTHGPFVPRRAIVSNHVIDRVGGRVAIVTPVTRIGEGRARPVTLLRSEGGTVFRTVHDFRKAPGVREANTRVERGEAVRGFRGDGYASPAARSGASSIYSRSYSRSTSRGAETLNRRNEVTVTGRQEDARLFAPEGSRSYRGFTKGAGTPNSIQRSPGRTYTRPQSKSEQNNFNYSRPDVSVRRARQSYSSDRFPLSRSERTIVPDRSGRSFSPPSRGEDWSSAPGRHQRSSNMPGSERSTGRSLGDRGSWSRR